jgi:hypothetical protein
MKYSKTISIAFLAAALALTGCKKKDDGAAKTDDKATPASADDKGVSKSDTPAAKSDDKPTAKTDDKAAPAGASDIASNDDYVKRGTAMMTKFSGIFKADGTDCDKLGTDLVPLLTDPEVKALDAYEKAHPEVKKLLDDATKDQMKEMAAIVEPATTKCKDNPKFADAMSKM